MFEVHVMLLCVFLTCGIFLMCGIVWLRVYDTFVTLKYKMVLELVLVPCVCLGPEKKEMR